ncbi:MAG: T9SS type A sorting domain-containing protein [Flavobacteriales bacterium]|nr:T9SS type A sorting domain-containing protein [Flavobacteriales bacterium]
MKKMLLVFGLGLTTFAQAQSYVNQAVILNEGYFDYTNNVIVEPVTIGSYNPATQVYSIVDTLENMRFGSDIIISGNYYYVAADSKIFKMDLNTHQELASVSCPGVRNLGIYQNKLVATRGEYETTFNSYLHVYDATNLTLIQAIDTVAGPKWAAQNIVMDGASAYIAVNNGYEWGNEKGIVGKLDLATLVYGNEIDLGPDGKNPDNLMKSGDFLYTVNNKDWSGASVSKISLLNPSASTVNLANASTGCGTSALIEEHIVYQVSGESSLNEFDYAGMNNVGPVAGISMNFYELAGDEVNNYLYASTTDFVTYGKVYVYDSNNDEVTNFNVGVSPGTIVFDIRALAGINELENIFEIYPNPAAAELNIASNLEGKVIVRNALGQEVIVSNAKQLNLNSLSAGTYTVTLNGAVKKFVKL